ncbi:MAG: hypothetical protein QM488_18455 [Rhizobiaceae bacterium]
MNQGTLIALRGIGNQLWSKGIDDFANMMADRGWFKFIGNHYERSKALEFLRSNDCPRPIVFMGHSMGVDTIDDLAEEWGRAIDLFVSIGSAWPEIVPDNVKRVLSIDAETGGRFHVKGGDVNDQVIIPDTTHTSVDDAPALHKLVREAMEKLVSDKSTLPVVPVHPLHNSILKDYEATWQHFMDADNEPPRQKAWQEAFFASVRGSVLKPLSQSQVDGLKTMVFIWRLFYSKYQIAFFAGVAGQSVKETGGKMVAVRETFADSDAQAVARLESAWAKGQLQAVGVRDPYWRDEGLGNGFGRGIIQLSRDSGYRKAMAMLWDTLQIKVNMVQDYNLALDPLVSAIVAFGGCIHGTFTSTKFSDYVREDGSFDFYNARSVVNGDKRRVGKEIEQDCNSFLSALQDAERAAPGWLALEIEPEPTEPVPVDPLPVPSGELTLENLRTWPSPDLMAAGVKASDLNKLVLIVLQERDNPEIQTKAAILLPQNEVETMTALTGTKHVLKSKRIWGLLGVLIGTFVPGAQPVIDMLSPEVIGAAPEVADQLKENGKNVAEAIRLVFTGLSALWALYGSYVAKEKLTVSLK